MLIVPSAPMVVKGDPTLMFTNAGMNQFKDIFLGNAPRQISACGRYAEMPARFGQAQRPGGGGPRHLPPYDVRDAGQLVLRRLLQERGDRMGLGTARSSVYGLPADRMYATVFEGSPEEDGVALRPGGLRPTGSSFCPRTISCRGNKHDNFWEMGETGPCGPCSRNSFRPARRGGDRRRNSTAARLVNAGHPHGDRNLEPGVHAVQPQG